MLKFRNYYLKIGSKTILENLNIVFDSQNIHIIIGKNGSGKSTFAQSIINNTSIQISGEVYLNNDNISDLSASQRFQKGIFVSFQEPPEVPGVSIINFLKTVIKNQNPKLDSVNYSDFLDKIKKNQKILHLDEDFYKKDLGYGLSGGQKKKLEILQMLIFKPSVLVLDEIDTGLDSQSINNLAEIINKQFKLKKIIIIISHNQKFIDLLKFKKIYNLSNNQLNIVY